MRNTAKSFKNWSNLNLLENKPRCVRGFLRHISSSFEKIFIQSAFLILTVIPCLAADFVDATEDSWLRTGSFCFRSGSGTNTQIHLAEYENGRFRELFSKPIGHPVMRPICFSNAVIVADVDGVISKIDFTGQFVFVAKPKGFEGLCEATGKLDANNIYVVGVVSYKHNDQWLNRYCLYIVDILGREPMLKTKFDIISPLKITRTLDDIIVVGETNIIRLNIKRISQ